MPHADHASGPVDVPRLQGGSLRDAQARGIDEPKEDAVFRDGEALRRRQGADLAAGLVEVQDIGAVFVRHPDTAIRRHANSFGIETTVRLPGGSQRRGDPHVLIAGRVLQQGRCDMGHVHAPPSRAAGILNHGDIECLEPVGIGGGVVDRLSARVFYLVRSPVRQEHIAVCEPAVGQSGAESIETVQRRHAVFQQGGWQAGAVRPLAFDGCGPDEPHLLCCHAKRSDEREDEDQSWAEHHGHSIKSRRKRKDYHVP